jgi:hypothetical protein
MTSSRVLVLVLFLLPILGCQRRPSLTAEPEAREPAESGSARGTSRARRAQASRRPPAGATCAGRDDCTSDQVCADGRCRYRDTSVAGEVLASAAEAQAEAGDWNGALETYEQAFNEFERRDAPVSPEIACGAAELILRTATDQEGRERGARRADLCFRITVPGDPNRMAVRRALARLRFEGLEIGLFDERDPAERFFTRQPSRPTVDALQIDVQMPDLEPNGPPSHGAIRDQLRSEHGRGAIGECFIQDWETHHTRSATADLRFAFRTTLRDMGTYDVYEPTVTIAQTGTAQDGFEPCLARALPALFDPENRSLRGNDWQQAVRVTVRIQSGPAH